MIKKMTFAWVIGCLTLTTVFAQQAATTEPIKGSQYVNDNYVEGTVFYADKSLTVPLRYNAFQDVMEYQQSGKPLVLDAKNVQRVNIGDETYVTFPYDAKGKQKIGFFSVLDSGQMTLFSKKSIVYQAPLKGRALDGGDLPAQYKAAPDTYYYRLGDGSLKEVDNLKSLLADLPENQNAIADFAKKEKISFKKEKDLVALVKQYNALAGPEDN